MFFLQFILFLKGITNKIYVVGPLRYACTNNGSLGKTIDIHVDEIYVIRPLRYVSRMYEHGKTIDIHVIPKGKKHMRFTWTTAICMYEQGNKFLVSLRIHIRMYMLSSSETQNKI